MKNILVNKQPNEIIISHKSKIPSSKLLSPGSSKECATKTCGWNGFKKLERVKWSDEAPGTSKVKKS